MLDIKLIVDTADKRYRLVTGAKGPLAGRLWTSKGEGACVAGFRLFGILLRMAFPASGGTGVLAGCCLEQQRGQHESTNYQMNRPLN